ncbi:plasmid partitioning protein RepB [Devosia sp. Naph2]|uniref:plasmid partitioning protein RepB n=1 Tax=Devosia polycyclovorans TaxID=3345148 RepID=UPI0035CF0597
MSRKDSLNSLFLGKQSPASTEKPAIKNVERVKSGAISAMGSSLQELTLGARAAARLQEQIDAGDHVVSIDPSLVDPSPIADRLPSDIDPGFDLLVASIQQQGQQVPVLVRPHPGASGRFQIAYGRRRLRALGQLGQPVRAIVRTLSDEEMVVAQGRENLDRSDLSFIEKALFARRLEDSGYDRSIILTALGADKADLSRYIAVARRVPEDLARKIGPAAKVGRARWTSLVEALDKPKASSRVDEVIQSEKFSSADSDQRFSLVLKALAPSATGASKSKGWGPPNGKRAAKIDQRAGQTAITFDEKRLPNFGAFVAARLDDLYEEFRQQGGE